MADLFLHLPFARRMRFADGLHPLAGEAIGRRPSLVVLGATLASLPAREREGMSWFRRLFSGGGEAARWQKQLAPSPGQPHVDLLVSILRNDEAALGPMARFALGAGLLAHELLEEKLAGVTASLQGPQKAGVERAQARLWLQNVERDLKGGASLQNEWRPVLELGEAAGDGHKRTVQHVDRALKRVYGAGPGEGTLGRWLKALAAEVAPLAEGRGGVPPSLTVADADARAAYFDQVAFIDKTRAAQAAFVIFVNRLAEAFAKGIPEAAALSEALGARLEEPTVDTAATRERWKTWQLATRDFTMTRGRNPKPAFAEGESGPHAQHNDHRLASVTKVMSLADLPPESASDGAPPLPEASGPTGAPPLPPTMTQEVSIAQIEAEARAFQAPPMTQEVSVAQIEHIDGFATPAHTQEVSTAQLLESAGITATPQTTGQAPQVPPANVTQPIAAADVIAANAEDAAHVSATSGSETGPVGPPPPPMTDPPVSVLPHSAPVAEAAPPADPVEPIANPAAPPNGANGVLHPPAGAEDAPPTAAASAPAAPVDPAVEPAKRADDAAEPPRE